MNRTRTIRLGWRTGGMALLACVALAGLPTLITTENLPVMAPIWAVVGGTVLFVSVLRFRQRTIPFSEIGLVYVAIVALYALYPLVGFVLNGLAYTPFNDIRLSSAQPTPTEIGRIGWYYVVHLLSFIVTYLCVRGRLMRKSVRFDSPGRNTLLALGTLYLGIELFLLAVDRAFDLSASTYAGSYLIFSRLPPGLAQVVFLLTGARLTVELALLAGFFCYYGKYRLLVWTWLVWMTVATFVRLGSRTELMLLLAAAILLYHTLVHPVPLRIMAGGGLLLLAMFVLLGMLRTGWLSSDASVVLNPFAYDSEFETIFGNAFHLNQLRAAGTIGSLPQGFYLSDILINIPRQLIPFEKSFPAEWYVNTFFPVYAAQGGGLAFGTISESVLGWGWLDLAARGAALGFLLAQVHRYYVRHRPSFWLFVFYIWLDTQIYQSCRTTTFFPVYLFLYRFFWVVVLAKFLAAVFKLIPRGQRRTVVGPALE